MNENIMLITLAALDECQPETYASFADLREQIRAIAKEKNDVPFSFVKTEADIGRAIFISAIERIRIDKGGEIADWILNVIAMMDNLDITVLPNFFEKCPDKSILPLW